MTLGAFVRHRAVAALRITNADSLMRWKNRSRLLVMCYHGVSSGPRAGKSWLLLPTAAFEQQVRFLARHYDVLPIDEALERLRSGSLTRPTACITFDDGYLNNFTEAFPILRRLDLPATIYLASGLIGTARRLWTTQLKLALESVAPGRVDLTTFGMDHVDLHTPLDASQCAEGIASRLKSCAVAERDARLEALYATLPTRSTMADDAGEFAMMDWSHVATMAASGLISFGGHTVNHEIVSQLGDAAQQYEIVTSVQTVHDALDMQRQAISRTFAYPNGRVEDFDQRAVRTLRESGCVAGLSTIEGLNESRFDSYAVRRIVIGGGVTFDNFRMRAAGIVEFARSFAR